MLTKTKIPTLIVTFFAVLLCSCANNQIKRVETLSGQPEVSIPKQYATKREVKELFVRNYQENGWAIAQDSEFSTKFIRPCGDGFSCMMGQALIGNSYSTAPNLEITLSWIEMDDKTKVIMNDYSMTTQMAFGQIKRQTMLGNNNSFNQQVKFLNSYKKYFMNSYGLYEGKVARGKIGIGVGQLTDEMREVSQLSKDEGILIVSLFLDGPAYNAGIKKGDILVSINDVAVNHENLLSILGNNIGKKVFAVVIRNGQRKTLSVIVAD